MMNPFGPQQFRAELLGNWDMEREHLLHDLGEQYHNRCDAFDDEHLRGPVGPGGGVLPDGPHERSRMISNAKFVMEHVVSLGRESGFSRDEVVQAIQRSGKAK